MCLKDSLEAADRYKRKTQVVGVDPYTVHTSETDIPQNVTFSRIYQFMVLDPNPFTGAAKDSSKGMDAVLYFKNGWVKKIAGRKIGDVFVVHGVVHHSFALSDKPLRPWVLIHTNGCILSAHCDCAIGILESCSHVGATLFALDGIRSAIMEQKVNLLYL